MNISQMLEWVKTQKVTSHSLAAAWVFLYTAYHTAPGFTTLADTMWGAVPTAIKVVIAGLAPLVLMYWKSTKQISE